VRFYFDWILDHRFTDFLAAKRDLLLYPPDEAAVGRFRAAIAAMLERLRVDEAALSGDAQRAFFLRRMAQETEPLRALALGDDHAARIADVEARLVEIQDLAREMNKT
jgi:hypothetical protein